MPSFKNVQWKLHDSDWNSFSFDRSYFSIVSISGIISGPINTHFNSLLKTYVHNNRKLLNPIVLKIFNTTIFCLNLQQSVGKNYVYVDNFDKKSSCGNGKLCTKYSYTASCKCNCSSSSTYLRK